MSMLNRIQAEEKALSPGNSERFNSSCETKQSNAS